MFRTFTRLTTPLVAGAAAFAAFPLRKSFFDEQHAAGNEQLRQQVERFPLYRELSEDSRFTKLNARTQFPKQHHKNMVTAGLLYGENLFEIDPIVFTDHKGKLFVFQYLGGKLISDDNKIHNGVTSTLLDEGLCAAGFPLLPSKKGVTANLSIRFENPAPPNSFVVLKAEVTEHKGRKVVIDGSIETLDSPTTVATAHCILVEPKWFKYFSWLQFI